MIDIDYISNVLGFEVEDMIMLIEMFIESSDDAISSLYRAIDDSNFEEIAKNAHTIKGSAANLNLESISQIAEKIEHLAKKGVEDNYRAMVEALDEELNSVKSTLSQIA